MDPMLHYMMIEIIGNFSFSRLRACKSASYINVQQKKWCPFGSLPFANFLDPPRDGEPDSFWCYTLLIRIRWVSGLPLLGVVTSIWDFSDLWFTVTLFRVKHTGNKSSSWKFKLSTSIKFSIRSTYIIKCYFKIISYNHKLL